MGSMSDVATHEHGAVAPKPARILLYSDNRNVREKVRFAVGSTINGRAVEWKETATLEAQFRGVKDKNVDQFRTAGKQIILFPERLKTGDLKYPFEDARQ